MKKKNAERKRTRRVCVCAFLFTLGVMAFAVGLYTVDVASGQTLHGSGYRPFEGVTISAAWLPPRLQVLWNLFSGEFYLENNAFALGNQRS